MPCELKLFLEAIHKIFLQCGKFIVKLMYFIIFFVVFTWMFHVDFGTIFRPQLELLVDPSVKNSCLDFFPFNSKVRSM